MIEIQHLDKRFGAKLALSDVGFGVADGGVTAILGPNGAGKSTLLRIILGLARADRGTATINGVAYRDLDRPLHSVGALLEGLGAHPSRTARNHLRWMAAAGGVERSRVENVLQTVGLADVAGQRVRSYSTGMRQRLALAVALLGDPPLLILDEPTNGLDPAGIRWIRELVLQWRAEGRTILLTSHLISEVSAVVDHLVILNQGQVVANGSERQIASRGQDLENVFITLTQGQS